MNFRKIALLATVCAFVLAVPAWAQLDVIHTFDQTGNAYGSQNDTASFGLFAQMYDNFTFAGNQANGSVSWTGEYFNPPQQGQITAWTIYFYNDNGGQPGTLNFKFTSFTGANETFLGTFGGFPTYTYSQAGINFSNLFPGTQYWLSVVPDLAFPPQWGWSSASNTFGPCDGCDGVSYQDFFGARSLIGADMTFEVKIGQSGVPEPGTLVMLGTGVLGLAGVIRRKLF